MTRSDLRQTLAMAPSWLVPAAIWCAVLAGAIALGVFAQPPPLPEGAGVGRMFPRLPAPPPNLRTLLYQLGVGSVAWYAAALTLPLLLWGARRVDSERRHLLRAVSVGVGTVVILFGLTSLLQYFVTYGGAPSRPAAGAYLPMALRQYLLPWVALVGVVVAVEARRRALHSAIERERLRAQVAEQRLIALTGQLHPHFLFNTLQGISTLIHRDAEAADEMLAKLSDLLRDLLRHHDRALVSLGDELRYARTYLEIAQLRFADRLTFTIDADEALHGAAVPLFILQPLVENALAHGIGGRVDGGRVSVKVWRVGERIRLEVADDGGGLHHGAVREGIGLGNTRERLRASFGHDQTLTLAGASSGGARATVEIPFRQLVLATETP